MKPLIHDSGRYRSIRTSLDYGPGFQAPVKMYGGREIASSPPKNDATSLVSDQHKTAAPKRSFFMTLIRRVFQPADQEKAKRVKEAKQALKDRVAKAKRLTVEFEACNKLFKKNTNAEQIRTNNSSITKNAPQIYKKTVAEFNDQKRIPSNDNGFSWKQFFSKKENPSVQMKLRRAAAKRVRKAIAQERMESSSPNGDTCANTPASQGVLGSATPLRTVSLTDENPLKVPTFETGRTQDAPTARSLAPKEEPLNAVIGPFDSDGNVIHKSVAELKQGNAPYDTISAKEFCDNGRYSHEPVRRPRTDVRKGFPANLIAPSQPKVAKKVTFKEEISTTREFDEESEIVMETAVLSCETDAAQHALPAEKAMKTKGILKNEDDFLLRM